MTGGSRPGWGSDLIPHRLVVPLRVPWDGHDVLSVTLLEGPAGWGEVTELPGYPCDPVLALLAAAEAARGDWPDPVRTEVPVSALVPAVRPEVAAGLAAEAVAAGISTVKVKVGAGDDTGRLSAVRSALPPGARLRIDANGSWDLDTATRRLQSWSRFELELAEQPVATLADMAALRRRVGVPLAADEAVRNLAGAREMRRLGAADAIVVKVQPLGGVRAALKVVEESGAPAVVTSMMETSVGLSAGLALAATLGDLPYACGLGTASLLERDVTSRPLLAEGGHLPVRKVVPDPLLLERLAYGRESSRRWAGEK